MSTKSEIPEVMVVTEIYKVIASKKNIQIFINTPFVLFIYSV